MRCFKIWLNRQGLTTDEVTDQIVTDYLEHLFENDMSASTARLTLAAIRDAGRKIYRNWPKEWPASTETLAGYRRSAPPPKQAKGLRWTEVQKIAEHLDTVGTYWTIRDAALLTVMSDGLLRASEITSVEVEDISRQPGGHALLRIRRSKSDPMGKGAVARLRESTVTRLDLWLEVSGITTGRLFAIHSVNLNLVVKRRIERAFGSSEGYSSHSLRVGGAAESEPAWRDPGRFNDNRPVAITRSRGRVPSRGFG